MDAGQEAAWQPIGVHHYRVQYAAWVWLKGKEKAQVCFFSVDHLETQHALRKFVSTVNTSFVCSVA